MRPPLILAAIPFVLGCAQQSVARPPFFPSDEPLSVRLYQPTGRMLTYQLSEPAYVAIFAVRRGDGVSMIFPYFQSQVDYRSHAGLNQEPVHRSVGAWNYRTGGRYYESALLARADAYYVIASKYPLPVEGMVNSPYLLRSLVGDVFRANTLSEAWSALEAILVEDLPDDAWASDVYINWHDPFATAYSESLPYLGYCRDRGSSYASAFFTNDFCNADRSTTTVTPPVQVVGEPRREPPKQPLDRDPSIPLPPDAAIARASRLGNEMTRGERPRRDAESSRAAIGRASDRSSERAPERRSEPPRAAERPAPSPTLESPPAAATPLPTRSRS